VRIVLDTNIWISGLLLPESNAGEVVSEWKNGHFEVVTSSPVLQEIIQVLDYQKIQKRLRWTAKEKDNFLSLLNFYTEVVPITNIPTIEVNLDSKDMMVLITLIISNADYLVTGDADLLILKEKYPIITLAEFCKKLGVE
jgi:putative PIN family toxin of toxin-antitoxin system